MTTIILNSKAASQNGITIDEALLMLSIHNKVDLEKAQQSLIQKGLITADRNDLFQQIGWRLTNKGAEVLDLIIADSDKHQEPKDRLVFLATKLKEIFPKGKKDGTNLYWTEGVALIVRRLKLFFKKYGSDYDDEAIIQAAKDYVRSFNGNYQYMKTLRYFIFKEKIGASKEVEGESDLINCIENADQESSMNNDWISELR